ncbi:MAG: bile acid:sodium symporter family protein [Kiritimatiellae bacterium]|jgi:BASS family bile acid:Na+ symporter|nr:bile acid:sodium symporter family protein [Kiritimatiellia bacterium]
MNPITGTLLTLIFASLAAYARWGKLRVLHGLGFTFSVFGFVAAAMTFPSFFISWGGFELKRTIVPLVQLILFGMGMTLTFEDFTRVLKMPKAILLGMALQYTIMPLVGFLCARAFGLTAEVAAGLVLIGSCPGGVASNVIAYLARGNVPLSVSMTACSTLASPLMTPLAMRLLAGTYVPIHFLPMMLSILKMIILPLIVGILIHRYIPKLAKLLVKVLPLLAMFSICVIIGITIALSRDDLLKIGFALLGAAACHNAIGYLLGYQGARLAGLEPRDCRTVALEVGIQNGGMATGLAFNVLKSAQAAMASATFGPWSAITSSVLASWWRKSEQSTDDSEQITVDSEQWTVDSK